MPRKKSPPKAEEPPWSPPTRDEIAKEICDRIQRQRSPARPCNSFELEIVSRLVLWFDRFLPSSHEQFWSVGEPRRLLKVIDEETARGISLTLHSAGKINTLRAHSAGVRLHAEIAARRFFEKHSEWAQLFLELEIAIAEGEAIEILRDKPVHDIIDSSRTPVITYSPDMSRTERLTNIQEWAKSEIAARIPEFLHSGKGRPTTLPRDIELARFRDAAFAEERLRGRSTKWAEKQAMRRTVDEYDSRIRREFGSVEMSQPAIAKAIRRGHKAIG